MADFNSKYSGEQVEALLDIVSEGGIGGGGGEGEVQKTTEAEITAMGFTKNLGTITEVKMNGVTKGTSGVVDLGTVITEHQDISGKVDKVSGKQLSTEDFTSALKTKLEGLSNYDDTEIENAITSLQTQFNTLVSGNASDAINSFNEIVAFLDGVKDTEDLSSIIASIEQQIAGKMDKVTLAKVATTGSYNDLSNKPTIPSAVTESTVSGWGFTKNTGTVTKVKINGSEKIPDANGLVDLGTIEGGGSSSGGSISYPVVEIGDVTASLEGLNPNTYYQIFGENNLIAFTLTVVLNEPTDNSVVNEYVFEFSVPNVLQTPSLSLPDTIKWANDAAPVIQKNKTYVVSIVNNLAVFAEF